jgi:hypothetical protein
VVPELHAGAYEPTRHQSRLRNIARRSASSRHPARTCRRRDRSAHRAADRQDTFTLVLARRVGSHGTFIVTGTVWPLACRSIRGQLGYTAFDLGNLQQVGEDPWDSLKQTPESDGEERSLAFRVDERTHALRGITKSTPPGAKLLRREGVPILDASHTPAVRWRFVRCW